MQLTDTRILYAKLHEANSQLVIDSSLCSIEPSRCTHPEWQMHELRNEWMSMVYGKPLVLEAIAVQVVPFNHVAEIMTSTPPRSPHYHAEFQLK
jgi:hypothetical protein